MADEPISAVPVDAPAPAATGIDSTNSTEPVQTNGGANDRKDDGPDVKQDTEPAPLLQNGDGPDASASAAALETDAASAAAGKDKKRKSIGGVPEHKSKKLNKKKSMPTLHLDCKPGEYYWARLKGFPPWPSIVCDEAMLPESLLASRPVSTTRPDGSIRDDFKEGGKHAKERTFPIMFLYTNEFQWMVNTALTPLDTEECKTVTNAKMSKALKGAYELAAEGHDLQYFKNLLQTWQEEEENIRKELAEQEAAAARQAEEDARNAEELAKQGKDKAKKKSRKSKAGDDTEMDDTDAPKSSKKRKKDGESEAEGSKPKKTPKVTKINAPKTPNSEGGNSTKKASAKPKKKVTPPKEETEEVKPELTEAERLVQREKLVLYLRHRLQKAFLSRDHAPQEEEMPGMADFFSQLESHEDLEPAIIRSTKIHKVLKAIIKLASIPKDEEYSFKKRSSAMLEIWNKRMEAEGETEPKSAVEPSSANVVAVPEANGHGNREEPVAETKPVENGDVEMKDAHERPTETSDVKVDSTTEQPSHKPLDSGTADKSELPAGTEIEPKVVTPGDVNVQTTSEVANA